jgi:Ohr subfamily peroxiredoxin
MTHHLEKVLYQAHAHATGGRDGLVQSSDGLLKVHLTAPVEMGGQGGGVNPEQLFAAGYSACFLSAIKFVARHENINISNDASVKAVVSLGPIPAGFGLEVELEILLPGLDEKTIALLVEKADQVCPYSNATRNNIIVKKSIIA